VTFQTSTHVDPGASAARLQASPSFVAAYERARRAWPGVRLAPDQYAKALLRSVDDGEERPSLDQLACEDLYLAAACIEAVPEALTAFESLQRRVVAVVLARMNEHGLTVEDVASLMRERLLVSGSQRPPGIAGFRGQGALEGWLRVTAGRIVLERRKREHREVYARSPELLERVASGTDPELLYLKQLYRTEFKQAFARAVSQLEPVQRNLLRYQVVHRLSIDRIADIYGAHRATAARWLVKARAELTKRTRDELAGKLALSGPELESVFRLIGSQLDVSLATVLA
jgi:RNA polymerase sigma-70 factor (ECF subfamily)